MPVGLPEFVDNPENRCPVVLLLDTSASMAGDPIAALNRGVEIFKQELKQDTRAALSIEVAIVSFGPVKLVQDFTTIDQFEPPALVADGFTPIGEAVDFGIDLLESRKQLFKASGIQYYRPWLFLITDGAPTDAWKATAERIHQGERAQKFSFFTVAVDGADLRTLAQLAPAERPPLKLDGMDFQSLFLWLSTSMKRVSAGRIGEAIALPPVGWGQV